MLYSINHNGFNPFHGMYEICDLTNGDRSDVSLFGAWQGQTLSPFSFIELVICVLSIILFV
jgi:hypothetical protein